MPLTLDWLLARDELDLRLVTDHDPADVTIDWVHSIELPDPSPWLAGGELVLTTGLRLPRSRTEQSAYARRLAEAGVAALAFGTGVRFETIPQALHHACTEVDLPLVDVPLPTPFVAVTQAIARRIAELQYESMERTVDFQRRLTFAALHEGAHGVVHGLADELGGGVLLLDAHRHVLESSRCPVELVERVRRELTGHVGTGRTSLRFAEGERSTEMQSLGGRTGSHGWLAIQTDSALPPTERVLLNQTASVLTLLLDSPAELVGQRRRIGATVLGLLLDPAYAGRAAGHLEAFGFESSDALAVLTCSHIPAATVEPTLADLDRIDAPWIATTKAGVALCILVRAVDAERFADRLRTHLAHSRDAVVGVSGAVSATQVRSGMSAAELAAESARWRRDRVGRHDDVALTSLLVDDDVRRHIDALAAPPLDRLNDHPVLTESLTTYLRTNGSWETASRMLGVHRHTLRNRMAKVEELTGLSLDVAENRVVLLLGLLSR